MLFAALVPLSRSLAGLLVAVALVLAMASDGRPAPLLVPTVRTAGALPAGVSQGRAAMLGLGALAELRKRSSAVVPTFPLGEDGTADLVLTRFEPFSPTARVEVVRDDGVHAVPLPDRTYFMGTVNGDPRSRVLVIAGDDAVRGFAVANDTVYVFGPDGAGGHRSYALRDADPTVWPAPGDFCANDLEPEIVSSAAMAALRRPEAGLVPPPIPPISATGLVQADVAVDTDHELWDKFHSDGATLDYLASLVAAGTAIYERDVAVRLRFSYIRLWATTSDPWTATSTSGQLDQVRSYWINPSNNMNAIAGSRDLVHFISGKSVSGGIAYVATVCNPTYGFGVSQVFGSFDLSSPSQIWDVLVTTHEMGHNLGTEHTHCYSPPVDKCYNAEAGCYSGPVVASRGTIMSYCHLLPGGLANIDLVFGGTVSTTIRDTVAVSSCLESVGSCGDGNLEAGEECDDGNSISGDGCSAACRFEVCGNFVVDAGETCDDGNTVSGDGCSSVCTREPRCGDGVLDAGEGCDDGNAASGDGCSASCVREPRCGDGILDPGEKCDDGNTTSGDGCSASCRSEACKVLRSGQTIWSRAQIMMQRSANGREKLALHATFVIAVPFASLSPATTGLDVLLENGAGQALVDGTLPAGSGWVSRRGKWIYRDPAGSVAGIRRLEVNDLTRGGLPEVAVSVTGRNGSYAAGVSDLPLALTIVLGDETAGLAGACGRRGFDAGSCVTSRGGSRLVCH
ncbi:MAG TPA: DUF4215 domain-containing protein [Candidatus Binatia bacterium]|nr:DUF4215 domain-containing protein [Candidatus Binatia bacterium]